MVTKVTCPSCKGNKFVRVTTSMGEPKVRACPACDGRGYQVRIVRNVC